MTSDNATDVVELKSIPVFRAGTYPQGEFDDDYIDKIAVAVNRGTLDLSWDDTGNTPTFDLTDKYWRYYERLIFGEILPDE